MTRPSFGYGSAKIGRPLLSGNARIPLTTLVGRQLRFNTRLSDGSDFARSGYISRVERLAADGSLTRYRLRVVPWLWPGRLLEQVGPPLLFPCLAA